MATPELQVPVSEKIVQDVDQRYFLPRNVEEAERMRNQHEWVKACAGGLVLAPIDLNRRGLRVLDAATADGYWMQDAKSVFPLDTDFLGFDSAYPPLPSTNPTTPATPLTITKQNLIEDFPSSWTNTFDFVHQRFVIPLFKDVEVPRVLHNLTSCLKPDGWIQLVEMDFTTFVSQPQDQCNSFRMIHELTSKVVSDPLAATKLADRLREEGLVNVGFRAVDMVAGAAHEDPVVGERGVRNMLSILEFFRSVTSPDMFGMSADEWDQLPKNFAQDMRDYRTALRVYFVWGQKPSSS
ncbi:hypothetical protein P175DRAFT_0445944 [Aspergillus ochraceoroseus IBT 24754]|uniref:Methyltransferase domain-containing protein n=1 Tax=Aspergillus ochraceoroseus IBT 24754 TaxID=1392256 RepID=A0A2T5LM93_9EURO|nr:uncharacterized protein P175DRAFT_0445944 [Aspergillus ochraceoroseus IBT 24754]PTU17402.1 hypothetical protein P175DRAFT_0445944 [Aspergillus ochraceoroseus IBT 24754]